jgi:hypothetical protein
MAHWNKVPRIQHESALDDLEGKVRKVLDFCEFDFEPACVESKDTGQRPYRELRAGSPAHLPRGIGPVDVFLAPREAVLGDALCRYRE